MADRIIQYRLTVDIVSMCRLLADTKVGYGLMADRVILCRPTTNIVSVCQLLANTKFS